MRVTGATPSWDYALQPSHQYGSFGSADIAAGGGAGDVGWHPDIFGHPRFAAGSPRVREIRCECGCTFLDADEEFAGGSIPLTAWIFNFPSAHIIRYGMGSRFGSALLIVLAESSHLLVQYRSPLTTV